MYYRWCWW